MRGFSNRAQNQIKPLAAFRNPQFYRAQAMRMPVWNIPRIICCAEYCGDTLALPRGCLDDVAECLRANGVEISIRDERCPGRSIDVSFNGALRGEQAEALKALSSHDNGILSTTTAFGKTVVGAALIAEKRVNTLVLVHRSQLMTQWKERLEQFLTIQEELPPLPKRRGRQKVREVVGLYGANRDTRGGIVDIAMLQSMGTVDDIRPWIDDYGMVIVDECHHVPAVSFEQVMKAVRSRYIYGLTATPKRQDGHHPILNMYLGPIRYYVDAKRQAMRRPFAHIMIPRFTGTRFKIDADSKAPAIGQYYDIILRRMSRWWCAPRASSSARASTTPGWTRSSPPWQLRKTLFSQALPRKETLFYRVFRSNVCGKVRFFEVPPCRSPGRARWRSTSGDSTACTRASARCACTTTSTTTPPCWRRCTTSG